MTVRRVFKSLALFSLVALFSSAAFAKYDPSRAENSWTFDEENNTITDGNWVFTVIRGKIKTGSERYSVDSDFAASDTGVQLALGGAAYQSGSGDVLDFTGTVTGSPSGNAYTIVFVKSKAFKGAPSVKELYLPKTLGSNAQIANEWSNSSLNTVVYDTPDYQSAYGISPNFGWGNKMRNVTTFYVNAPKLKQIGQEETGFSFGTLEDTDVSDWVLTSLTALHIASRKAFAGKLFTGTIRLPSMVSLYAGSFANCTRLEGAEIGTSKTSSAITIGASSFAGDESLAEVKLGGGSCSFSIGTNAFACAALEKVTLNGGVPVCADYAPGAYAFGTDETPANSIVFVVENSSAWRAVLDDPALVTRWTDEERIAYAKAHPGKEVPMGSAAASVFSTAAPQLIALPNSWGCALPTVVQTSETRYGSDLISVVCDCQPYADGSYPIYAKVTVAITTSPTGHFAEWLDLPYSDPDKTNAARVADCPIFKAPAKVGPARFNHDWTATQLEEKEIANNDVVALSDGVWKLNAMVIDKANRKLRLGTNIGKHLLADDNTASGFLDLTGPVSLGGQRWKLTEYASNIIGDAEKAAFTDIYIPEDTENLNVQGWRDMKTTLTNLVINCPNSGEYLASYGFQNNNKLTRLVLRVPKVKYIQITAFGYSGHTYDCRYKNTNLDDWDLSGVETVGDNAFVMSDSSLTGTLRLPKVRSIGTGAFLGFAHGVRAVEFNSGKSASLSIAKDAFKTEGSFLATNLNFRAKSYSTFSIDPAAFSNLSYLKSVTFEGTTENIATGLDNLLAVIAESNAGKAVTIRGCAALGWKDVGDQTFVTDEEAEAAPTFGYLGVWREGSRKAWIVDYKSLFGPKGTVFLLH